MVMLEEDDVERFIRKVLVADGGINDEYDELRDHVPQGGGRESNPGWEYFLSSDSMSRGSWGSRCYHGESADALRAKHNIQYPCDAVRKIVSLNQLTKKDKLMKFMRNVPTLSTFRKALGVSPTNSKYKIDVCMMKMFERIDEVAPKAKATKKYAPAGTAAYDILGWEKVVLKEVDGLISKAFGHGPVPAEVTALRNKVLNCTVTDFNSLLEVGGFRAQVRAAIAAAKKSAAQGGPTPPASGKKKKVVQKHALADLTQGDAAVPAAKRSRKEAVPQTAESSTVV